MSLNIRRIRMWQNRQTSTTFNFELTPLLVTSLLCWRLAMQHDCHKPNIVINIYTIYLISKCVVNWYWAKREAQLMLWNAINTQTKTVLRFSGDHSSCSYFRYCTVFGVCSWRRQCRSDLNKTWRWRQPHIAAFVSDHLCQRVSRCAAGVASDRPWRRYRSNATEPPVVFVSLASVPGNAAIVVQLFRAFLIFAARRSGSF